MSLRPVLYAIDQENVAGCGAQSCVKAVMLVGTPAMWFIAVPVLGWALWRAFVKSDWRYAVALVGYGAGFLPWFADIDRQMYFFYAAPMAPFLVMAIAMILGDILLCTEAERRATDARPARRALLCGRCDHELRVDVPDPHGPADLAVDLEHADLAAQLAVGTSSPSLRHLYTASSRRRLPLSTTLGRSWLLAPRVSEHRSRSSLMGTIFLGSEAIDRDEVTWGQLRWKYRAIYPDVYTPNGAEPSLYTNTVGAWLWSGRKGPVTGRAAAALHGSLWVDENAAIELLCAEQSTTQRHHHAQRSFRVGRGPWERCTVAAATPQRAPTTSARHCRGMWRSLISTRCHAQRVSRLKMIVVC